MKRDYKPQATSRARRISVRKHHYVLGGAVALFLGLAVVTGLTQPSGSVSADPASFVGGDLRPLDLPSRNELLIERNEEKPAAVTRELVLTVKSGDSLAALFDRHNLDRGDLHAIMQSEVAAERLRKLMPGDSIAVQASDEGKLLGLSMDADDMNRLDIHRDGNGFAVEKTAVPVQRVVRSATGTIDSSLFAAGYDAGLSDTLIMNLAGIFGWDIDFALDIRKGDQFRLIYEEIYRDGEKLKDGPILAAEFTNEDRELKAVRFVDDEGDAAYYAPDGRAMRKTFLRAPLNFQYVSSSFNPNRYHPILKRVKAHNGIDYRAPKGTPVYAAGDGRVVRSAYNKYNGHHVFIQHGERYVTKYLHFTHRTVRNGERVRQGQVIGYVGATGLASGPHLHYEFLVNGVHRNPRTVNLPDAEPIADKYREEFLALSAPLLRQLEVVDADTRVAIAP
ncbi:MAG: peptidoglycan DD-metalloendopeptidase family protein [Gammaproteobacteria bacterium]|nr:peptidoglycan DD-metalloendopeptidase family protein [Gammaproteobacteria bacterium]